MCTNIVCHFVSKEEKKVFFSVTLLLQHPSASSILWGNLPFGVIWGNFPWHKSWLDHCLQKRFFQFLFTNKRFIVAVIPMSCAAVHCMCCCALHVLPCTACAAVHCMCCCALHVLPCAACAAVHCMCASSIDCSAPSLHVLHRHCTYWSITLRASSSLHVLLYHCTCCSITARAAPSLHVLLRRCIDRWLVLRFWCAWSRQSSTVGSFHCSPATL